MIIKLGIHWSVNIQILFFRISRPCLVFKYSKHNELFSCLVPAQVLPFTTLGTVSAFITKQCDLALIAGSDALQVGGDCGCSTTGWG